MANLEGIIEQLKAERDRLDAAISALTSVNGASKPNSAGTAMRGTRRISAAARARISAAQKARWARTKGTQSAAPKRRMLSPAARRRIAAAQKARWAKVRASRFVNS